MLQDDVRRTTERKQDTPAQGEQIKTAERRWGGGLKLIAFSCALDRRLRLDLLSASDQEGSCGALTGACVSLSLSQAARS